MSKTINLFGMTIDAIDMPAALARLESWIASPAEGCRFVVTPNTDHAVMFQENAALRQAYRQAGMVVADGAPVVVAARLLGRKLPGRVTGSDMVPAMFTARTEDYQRHECDREPPRRLRVYLLGAAEGVAERAAQNIEQRWPAVEVVGCYSPPMGFEKDEEENAKIIRQVNAANADILVLGLGAPKQELWAGRFQSELQVPVALCVGATIDFLAGEKQRAPRWMQRLGLEWLHRCATEPQRLVKRYARDAWVFPRLIYQDACGKFSQQSLERRPAGRGKRAASL